MTTFDVWEPQRATRAERLVRRGRESLRVRWARLVAALGGRYTPHARTGRGPSFRIERHPTSFEELEAIVFHPEVLADIERDPPAPIAAVVQPTARPSVCAPSLAAPPRRRPATIYDVTPMSMELDVLEMRLLEMWDLVDRFVVCESSRTWGGFTKPLYLQRNLGRFERFREKLVPIVVDNDGITFPAARERTGTSQDVEDALRAAAWRAVRRHVDFDPDGFILSSDLDEFPPRHFVAWLRDYDVELPLRVRLPALRYTLGWVDDETSVDLIALSAKSLRDIDANPHLFRHHPARVVRARGAVHLTSFLSPLGLIAKFAMTTDWDPAILPFVRNEHGESEAMMAEGRWFERRLRGYDPEADPETLVPWAARAHRPEVPREAERRSRSGCLVSEPSALTRKLQTTVRTARPSTSYIPRHGRADPGWHVRHPRTLRQRPR